MDNQIAISKDDVDKLVGIGFTGHDIGLSNIYPRSVNILQSDKQYEAFTDGDNITKKMYGKLFVRGDINKTSDLVDKIEGTMIKVEKGYEIRNGENGIEESGYGFLSATQKAEYTEQGLKPINMVKVLIGLEDAETTNKKMVELKKKMDAGEIVTSNDYPFALVVVKGSSFESWFNVEKQMQDLANEYFNRPLSQIPIIAFRLVVTSNKEEGEGFTYYSMDFDVKPNDPKEALAFTPYLLEAKNQKLFYKVKERVAEKEAEKAPIIADVESGAKSEEVRDALKFTEEIFSDSGITDSDLPF